MPKILNTNSYTFGDGKSVERFYKIITTARSGTSPDRNNSLILTSESNEQFTDHYLCTWRVQGNSK